MPRSDKLTGCFQRIKWIVRLGTREEGEEDLVPDAERVLKTPNSMPPLRSRPGYPRAERAA